jgi:hypothetical protein
MGDSMFANVYEGWRWDHFLETQFQRLENPNAPAALTEDPDADGMNNFVEYAFGRDPVDHVQRAAVGGTQHRECRWDRLSRGDFPSTAIGLGRYLRGAGVR